MDQIGHAPLGYRAHPLNFLNSNPHIWYIKMEGFLTLRTMAVIILTYDLPVTHYSRSSVNPSYHGLFNKENDEQEE